MDGTAAISSNLEALRRIVAGMVGMAGLASRQSATASRQAEQPAEGLASLDCPWPAACCRLSLPRHLLLAILRLLRPAEAAARRLIIAAARGLVVPLPPPRNPRPKLRTVEPLLRRLGIAVVVPFAHLAGARRAVAARPPRTLCLPLFDPPRRLWLKGNGRRRVPANAAPRIRSAGGSQPFPLPPPTSPNDPVDATRLGQRLAALAAALDDLPGQASRFARWRARKDAHMRKSPSHGRIRRISPLRPGRPPGGRLARFDPSTSHPRNIREVDEILAHAHALALCALERPDTS